MAKLGTSFHSKNRVTSPDIPTKPYELASAEDLVDVPLVRRLKPTKQSTTDF